MRVTELDLSAAALASLQEAGIHDVDELTAHTCGELIERPEFNSGIELHEIACALHQHGLTFSRYGGHILTRRELDMLRLRAVDGLTLKEIAPLFALHGSRVDQLLRLHFRLDGPPPAARARRRSRRRSRK